MPDNENLYGIVARHRGRAQARRQQAVDQA